MESAATAEVNSLPDSGQGDWPARPWVLAALLGLAGLAVHFARFDAEDVAWRMALAALFFFGAMAFAFTLDRERWKTPLAFATGAGLVMAGLAFHAVRAGDRTADSDFAFAAGVLALGLSVPLFQAGFHRHRFATSYSKAYHFVWTDAISAGGALAFTGLSWLVLFLLSALFELLRIELLTNLIDEEWFGWTFSGIAFGAALGLLRNQLKILSTLQTVGLLVLSLLAVPLALGLIVFLFAMIVSGPEVLWEATRSATPVLLACAAGAFVLVNAVIRDSEDDRPRSRALRIAALVLALAILPLTVFAATSMGTRIDQHGLSPERLWGLCAIVVAVVCGVAYALAAARGRADWMRRLREANLHLAVILCAIALLLALPILDFGAISARNQVARLASGQVSPDTFDYDALRWEFGDGGRAALRRLARSDSETIAEAAQAALERDSRAAAEFRRGAMLGAEEPEIAFDFADPALSSWLRAYVRNNPWTCSPSCTALDLGMDGERRHAALVGPGGVVHVYFRSDGVPYPPEAPLAPPAPAAADPANVEVRPYAGRRIYVNGRAVGEPFD